MEVHRRNHPEGFSEGKGLGGDLFVPPPIRYFDPPGAKGPRGHRQRRRRWRPGAHHLRNGVRIGPLDGPVPGGVGFPRPGPGRLLRQVRSALPAAYLASSEQRHGDDDDARPTTAAAPVLRGKLLRDGAPGAALRELRFPARIVPVPDGQHRSGGAQPLRGSAHLDGDGLPGGPRGVLRQARPVAEAPRPGLHHGHRLLPGRRNAPRAGLHLRQEGRKADRRVLRGGDDGTVSARPPRFRDDVRRLPRPGR
mmetsp:Transcript_5448/g.13689  ORF Transcript_5448/g.13689 Transcript_5448/m.13689 type:complete len:251 (+) Transcript_5448:545-1297(+)